MAAAHIVDSSSFPREFPRARRLEDVFGSSSTSSDLFSSGETTWSRPSKSSSSASTSESGSSDSAPDLETPRSSLRLVDWSLAELPVPQETDRYEAVDMILSSLEDPEVQMDAIDTVREICARRSGQAMERLLRGIVDIALRPSETTNPQLILLEPGPLALFSALDGLGERNALAIEASFSLILELIFRQIHHGNIHRASAIIFSHQFQRFVAVPYVREQLLQIHYVGDYLVTGKILGKGSWGEVHVGYNRTTGERVAIKIMGYHKASEETKRYLAKEVALMKELQHTSVIKLYDATLDETGKSLYVIMEYCELGNLEDYLRSRSPKKLSSDDILHFMREIAFGLEFLRSRNIVHRDLKLENILVRKDDLGEMRLKLCDFTFAKSLSKSQMTSTVCGSPLYMAPEILNGQKYTEKADLWSVGVIMYQLLFEDYPYKAETIPQLSAVIARSEVKFPEGSYCSDEAVDLLKRLLDREPFKRIEWDAFFRHPYLKMRSHKTFMQNLIEKLRDKENGILAFADTPDYFTGGHLLQWLKKFTAVADQSVSELGVIRELQQCEDGIVAVKRKGADKQSLDESKDDFPERLSVINVNSRFVDMLSGAFQVLSKSPKATFATIYDSNGHPRTLLRSATLSQIVNIYCSEPTNMSAIRHLLLAHAQFFSSIKFFRALETIAFPEASPSSKSSPSSPSASHRSSSSSSSSSPSPSSSTSSPNDTSRARAIAIIAQWIDLRRDLFDGNTEVKRALVAAISRDNNNNAEPSDYVKHILSKLDAHQVDMREALAKAPKTLKPKRRKKGSTLQLELKQFSPIEIARQLTIIDEEFYGSIPMDELMKAKWVTTADSKKESAAPSVLRFTNYQNRLALWLAWLIVKERRQKKRIKRISFILCIAKELMELNNFNSSMTVYLALTLSPVRRLVATWANLPKPSTQIWQNLQELMSPRNNFSRYRKSLQECIGGGVPVIPIQEITLKDLLFQNESMSDFLDDEKKIVNMLKLDAMGLVLENYALFSGEKWCYILKEEASTSNLLRNIPTVDLTILNSYSQSYDEMVDVTGRFDVDVDEKRRYADDSTNDAAKTLAEYDAPKKAEDRLHASPKRRGDYPYDERQDAPSRGKHGESHGGRHPLVDDMRESSSSRPKRSETDSTILVTAASSNSIANRDERERSKEKRNREDKDNERTPTSSPTTGRRAADRGEKERLQEKRNREEKDGERTPKSSPTFGQRATDLKEKTGKKEKDSKRKDSDDKAQIDSTRSMTRITQKEVASSRR